MNEFKESLKFNEYEDNDEFEEDEEFIRLALKAQIHPMLPTKYNALERARLRKFEQELLKGRKVDIEDWKDIER